MRDYSGRCRKVSTWGTRPGVLWVTNGCQGRFQAATVAGRLRGQNVQASCRYYPSGNRTEIRF